jgi:protoporphyrinogen oxidase
MKTVETVILGAGLSGLSAAYHLSGKNFVVIEKRGHPGGLCTTEKREGFLFDQTGHWLHLSDERTKELFKLLFGDEFVEIIRKTHVFSHDTFTQYPFQSNTFGLPPDVIKECVLGFIKAHYEKDKSKASENFYEWCMAYLGEGISKHFMIPYNSKIYTVHPKEYASHWCDKYVPVPTLEQVIEGAVTAPEQKNIGYNATFKYPVENGIGELPKRLFDRCEKEKFIFSSYPVEIDTANKIITLNDGETIRYSYLVNTIPLKDFLLLVKGESELHELSDRLKIASVSYFNTAIKKKPGHPGHWFYIPEEKFMPYRIGSFSNIYSKMAPEGKGSFYIEYTHQGPIESEKMFRSESIKMMKEMKLIDDADDIIFMDYRIIENGYVIYHKEYFEDMDRVLLWSQDNDIFLAGRYGKWVYAAMEDAIIDGMNSALKITEAANE